MKKIIFLFVFFVGYYSFFAQNNAYKEFSGGVGKTKYMDTYYFPGGINGSNFSILYNLQNVKLSKLFSISLFNIQFSYANLGRKDVAKDIYTPTYFFDLSVKKEWLYQLPIKIQNFRIGLGLNTMFVANYYKNVYNKPYIINRYGRGTLSVGASQISTYTIGKFIFENRSTLPLIVYGFFMEYQNYYSFYTNFLYKHTQFVFINNYFQFNNNFSIEYPLFKNSSLKLSYLFESYYSVVNEITVKDIKHQFLVGLVLRK